MIYVASGYSGSGSSAIVHLLSEYSCCTTGTFGKYEHLLFYIPDGLFDLEDRLLMNNSIHMSDGAIKRFYWAMWRLYDNDFGWFGGYKKKLGTQFMKIVEDFIKELIQYTQTGYWSDDFRFKLSVKGVIKDTAKFILKKPIKKFGHIIDNRGKDNVIQYSFVSPEEFYTAARKFVKNYCKLICSNTDKIYVYDQLLLPHNLYRVNNYFDKDDIRIILVDRDPRDMFVLSKYVWPHIIPGCEVVFPENAGKFVEYYKKIRASVHEYTDSNIIQIRFEDLVYNYDTTVSRLESFLNLKRQEHINSKKAFNPDQSIKNTQNFRINREWIDEIRIIEKKLPDSLYSFPYVFIPDMKDTSDP